jgi:hypothetical protein
MTSRERLVFLLIMVTAVLIGSVTFAVGIVKAAKQTEQTLVNEATRLIEFRDLCIPQEGEIASMSRTKERGLECAILTSNSGRRVEYRNNM